MTRYRTLETDADAEHYVTDAMLENAVDWFPDDDPMPTDEYLNRLFPRYGGPTDEHGAELDLDSLDNEAARNIMRRARRIRRDRNT